MGGGGGGEEEDRPPVAGRGADAASPIGALVDTSGRGDSPPPPPPPFAFSSSLCRRFSSLLSILSSLPREGRRCCPQRWRCQARPADSERVGAACCGGRRVLPPCTASVSAAPPPGGGREEGDDVSGDRLRFSVVVGRGEDARLSVPEKEEEEEDVEEANGRGLVEASSLEEEEKKWYSFPSSFSSSPSSSRASTVCGLPCGQGKEDEDSADVRWVGGPVRLAGVEPVASTVALWEAPVVASSEHGSRLAFSRHVEAVPFAGSQRGEKEGRKQKRRVALTRGPWEAFEKEEIERKVEEWTGVAQEVESLAWECTVYHLFSPSLGAPSETTRRTGGNHRREWCA